MKKKNRTRKELDKAIGDLLDFAEYASVKKGMWDWLKLSVTGNFEELDKHERDFIFILYERLKVLVRTAHKHHRSKVRVKETKASTF